MKRRLLSFFAPVMALAAAGIIFSSCSDDVGAEYLDEFYKVTRSQWAWNEDYERWEVFYDNANVDSYMYEYGVTNGYVWLYEGDVETRKQLEYNYLVVYQGEYYDITIGYDISPRSIGFYIYTPEYYIPREAIPSPLDFKVTLMWQ
ncbi:MAG: hypothetical protein LUE26_07460 [Alistipes sp.]|nr:hypothetical protein [Alistipes sp.]